MSSKKSNSKSTTLDETMVGKQGNEKVVSTSSLKEFNKTAPFSFNSKNYKILLIGLAVNILGFILMIGGATDDPNEFHYDELFSSTRITIAPMLIVAGYLVIMYAIMKRPKSEE